MEIPPYLVPNLDFGKMIDQSQYPNQKSMILLNARVEQLAAENQIMAHRLKDGGQIAQNEIVRAAEHKATLL